MRPEDSDIETDVLVRDHRFHRDLRIVGDAHHQGLSGLDDTADGGHRQLLDRTIHRCAQLPEDASLPSLAKVLRRERGFVSGVAQFVDRVLAGGFAQLVDLGFDTGDRGARLGGLLSCISISWICSLVRMLPIRSAPLPSTVPSVIA